MAEILVMAKEELIAVIQQAVSEAINQILSKPVLQADSNDDTFINVEQVAELLHKKRSTIYYLVRNRSIPLYKRGNRLLFKKSEIQNWIEKGKQRTNEEISEVVKQRNI